MGGLVVVADATAPWQRALDGFDALTALRPVANALSPGGRRGKLSILIYHRVLPSADPLRPFDLTAAAFRWQMRLLARQFRPLPLTTAIERLAGGTLPARAVAVTFDDGYADNYSVALPILREAGVPATFFIAAGFLDGGRMWNDTVIEAVRRMPAGESNLEQLGLGRHSLRSTADRLGLMRNLLATVKYQSPEQRNATVERLAALVDKPLPDDLMMTTDELRLLHQADMEIGGHTLTHPILARLSKSAARQEIAAGKEQLEGIIGESLRLFAYPNGKPGQDYLPEHVGLVAAAGFGGAVSTTAGVALAASDRFQLPRFTPWDRTPARFMSRMLLNCRRPG